MSSAIAAIPTDKPSQLPAIAPKEAKQLRISGKVRTAIEAMVWQGLKRSDAAEVAGLKDNSLYVAFMKPDVKAYYAQQCEVLRTSGRARRIHRLEAMLEQSDNKAAVINAALALESIGTDQATANAAQSARPGVVVQILMQAPVDARLTQPAELDAEMRVIST
jgi:hypothetical protein